MTDRNTVPFHKSSTQSHAFVFKEFPFLISRSDVGLTCALNNTTPEPQFPDTRQKADRESNPIGNSMAPHTAQTLFSSVEFPKPVVSFGIIECLEVRLVEVPSRKPSHCSYGCRDDGNDR
ncbi:hypothetical protein TcG_07331 [Trypanosoma cruzi]|nr:hypothetical protein TcG_07331 [Trypanosoma cruzi]